VEISLGQRATTVGPGCGGSPAGVVLRPLDPPVEVPGKLLVTPAGERPALRALVAAFTSACSVTR
jgi:hypothetical protein